MAEAPWRQTVAPTGATTKPRPNFTDHRPEPPPCVQNAMLTKDKKPFTYTPGGIDLSEIRSPRMARRLERNALSEGITPTPQAPPGQQRAGPLPPSALAAMQPQLPVQVFPSGVIPQPPHCAPPPPPPPPMLELDPLPLDSLKRPDMTKIIPDNPMNLLRKTQGPVVKQDPILNKQSHVNNRTNNTVVPQKPADTKINNSQIGSIYVAPINQNFTTQTPIHDSPTSVAPPPPAFYKRQPSLQQAEPPSPPYVVNSKQAPTFDTAAQAPESPKTTLSKAPTPWLKQRNQSQDVPEWAVNDQKVTNTAKDEPIQVQKPKLQRPWAQKSLDKQDCEGYMSHSELHKQQQPQIEPQHQQQGQPQSQTWPQKQVEQQPLQPKQPDQRQWQQKQPEPQQWKQQQPESHDWQQKQHEPQSWQQNQQSEFPSKQFAKHAQSPPVQVHKTGGVQRQIQNRENPQEYCPNEKVEVVIVNDPPPIFQHPGQSQRMQRQQPSSQQPSSQQPSSQQHQTVRIIPVQIEGATSNGHSNNDPRSLNRQQSWNSNPTQSNTFKVLQKITHTDGDDEDDNQEVIEHAPRSPQNFPQHNVQRMKLNQSDQELMNKFKQGIDQDNSIHKEIDPRYRGPNIPSKAFKLLQNMTSGQDGQPISSSAQEEQVNSRGPKVRTIPIQIEGDGPPRTFVPPSEQTAVEPKKYMGSAIPSRSFKILQAMTASDECGPGQSDM